MKPIISATLLVLALALGVYGALSSPEPEKSSPAVVEQQPPHETGQRAGERGPGDPLKDYGHAELSVDMEEWLKFSPMRVKMRGMWLNCGIIVARTTAPLIDYDGLESAASDIARKAGQFAEMWEAVRDHNRNMAAYAKEEDWFNARFESQRLWMVCTDCHVENWSPYTRGFLPESIETWYDRGYATERAPYAFIRLTTPPQFYREMFVMIRNLNMAVGDIGEHHVEGVMEASKNIHEVIQFQMQNWQAIARYAENIRKAAARTETEGIETNYNKMTSHCAGCHARFVHDGRLPLNPLPFPPADD